VSGADPFDLRVLPAAAWASVVAGAFLERLRARPGLRVCLPTGDTPGPLYAELAARDARSPDGAYAQATVVLLDEWLGLPPGDSARCDVRLRRELLDRLAPPPRFVGIDVDASDDSLAALAHDRAARGLDLALLGLGMNGHVGFNEPGSRPDDATRVVRLARSTREAAMARYGAVQAPTGGITVGLARLLEAEDAWLLVTGAHKASILRRALRSPEGPDCPASYLRRHPRLTVFADEAAAGEL
jgi:glucosamine-6-phosphate deaminase